MKQWLRQLKRGKKHDLSYVLGQADPSASLHDRVIWFEQLIDWIRADENDGSKAVRIRFLLQILERNPEWKKKSAQLIISILGDSDGVRLYTETGVPSWESLFQEALSRFIKVFFPGSANGTTSLKSILEQVFYDDGDATWVNSISSEIQGEIYDWLALGVLDKTQLRKKFLIDLVNASLILSIKSAAISMREDFAIRSPKCDDVIEHPTIQMQQQLIKVRHLLDGLRFESIGAEELKSIEVAILEKISRSKELSQFIKLNLQNYGVSVDLVYQRDRLKLYVERIEIITNTLFSILENQGQQKKTYYTFFSSLVQGSSFDRDFAFLLKKNFSLISKKIVDFTGNTGESYIAQNSHEYSHLFWYAVGGGFLTAFTVVMKYAVDQTGWPMFLTLFYAFCNYSLSFLLMHFLHFKLATKQPSMTAAALASKLQETGINGDTRENDEVFVDEIAKISRSQFASVLGNLIAVIPTAMLINYLWFTSSGKYYFDASHAEHVIESIHPWHTLTVLYAAMTGVLLFLSGLTSGWVENAMVYYRVPELIRHHKVLNKILGTPRTSKIADAYLRNISGITSAVSLGFYLALWPVLGNFFGLPLDIRHITLTTGSIAMAVQSLGVSEISGGQWVLLALGITLIGLMNFSVSFVLASLVALRAKEVSARRALRIFGLAFHRWTKSPFQFMIPR